MKKVFTKDYILENRGCYSKSEVEELKCINSKTITLKQLFRDLPIKDFTWWLAKKCDLTLTQKRQLAIDCADFVLPIFEEKYPEDQRPRKAIEAAKEVVKGNAAYAAAAAAADAAAATACVDLAWSNGEKLWPTVFSSLNSRVKIFVFAASSRRQFSIFM